jgi:hypothetical protein
LVAGSSPVSRSISADVAQLVEHFLGKEEVTGSIPVISSLTFFGSQAKETQGPPSDSFSGFYFYN